MSEKQRPTWYYRDAMSERDPLCVCGLCIDQVLEVTDECECDQCSVEITKHYETPALSESAVRIARECDRIKAFLVEKNLAYGDSAGDPVRIFSKSSAEENLLVRIDDKLSRIARGSEYLGDDTILDLAGYLILLRVVRGQGE